MLLSTVLFIQLQQCVGPLHIHNSGTVPQKSQLWLRSSKPEEHLWSAGTVSGGSPILASAPSITGCGPFVDWPMVP